MEGIKIDQCYILTPESIQENETYKIFWDFEIQTDQKKKKKNYYEWLRKRKIATILEKQSQK